jgi:hypothetical protein
MSNPECAQAQSRRRAADRRSRRQGAHRPSSIALGEDEGGAENGKVFAMSSMDEGAIAARPDGSRRVEISMVAPGPAIRLP